MASLIFPSDLLVIIRFSNSLPDLPLNVSSPESTTPITLYTMIRPHLPPSIAASSLRLIYSGALLGPSIPLRKSLNLSSTGKSPAQLYLHCSISIDNQLSAAQLEAETKAAHSISKDGIERNVESQGIVPAAATTVHPAPQGFDRLLSAGLSAAEVASLRSQFLAVQAYTHTPDTMPSSAEMRVLEERWLDAGSTLNGGNGNAGTGGDDEGEGELGDILWGNLIGFFWAVGAVLWLVREEGVWSKRRQIGVVTGVLANIAVCLCTGGIQG